MPDPRVFFLSISPSTPSREIPLDWLREHHEREPDDSRDVKGAVEVAPGVMVTLMGTGHVILPDGTYGYGARVAVWDSRPREDENGIRQRIAASLRRAAAGRREYAEPFYNDIDSHVRMRGELLAEAAAYESAAKVIEDPSNLLRLIPSWRWTDEDRAPARKDENRES